MSRVKTLEDRLAIIDTHIKKGTIIELGASKTSDKEGKTKAK